MGLFPGVVCTQNFRAVETLPLDCTGYFLELSLLTAFSKGSNCPVQSEPGSTLALEGK